jgi:hypothetical protein
MLGEVVGGCGESVVYVEGVESEGGERDGGEE